MNYESPADALRDEHPFIVHWCVIFKVLFHYAEVQITR